MLEWDDWMCGWAAMGEQGQTLKPGGHGRGRLLSVGQGLIEPQVGLGWGAGGTQGRRPTGKIEVGEDGANGKGIGDEGDDAHGSAARRAEERQDLCSCAR